jgi:anthranilate synthase component 2
MEEHYLILKKYYTTMVKTVVDDELLFEGLGKFEVGRYHSWVVDPLYEMLEATSFDENGQNVFAS